MQTHPGPCRPIQTHPDPSRSPVRAALLTRTAFELARGQRLSSAYLPSRAAINGLALSEEAQPNRLLPSQASPPKPFTRLRSLDEVIAEEAESDVDSFSRTADGGGGGGKAERFAFGTRLESHGTDGTAAAHLSRAEFEQALAAAEARVMEHVASEFRALRARIGGA
jgi:hypothetical protein